MASMTYTGLPSSFKLDTLMDELVAALAADAIVPYVQGAADGSAVVVDVPEGAPRATVEAVIAAHDPSRPSRGDAISAQTEAARLALDAVDVLSIRDAIAAGDDVAALRSALEPLVDVVAHLVAAARR